MEFFHSTNYGRDSEIVLLIHNAREVGQSRFIHRLQRWMLAIHDFLQDFGESFLLFCRACSSLGGLRGFLRLTLLVTPAAPRMAAPRLSYSLFQGNEAMVRATSTFTDGYSLGRFLSWRLIMLTLSLPPLQRGPKVLLFDSNAIYLVC